MAMYCSEDVWLTNCLRWPCFITSPDGQQTVDQLLTQYNSLFITCKVLQDDTEGQEFAKSLGFIEINNQVTFTWRSSDISPFDNMGELSFVYSCTSELGSDLAHFAPYFLTDRFREDARLPKSWSTLIKSKWLMEPDEDKTVLLAKFQNKIVGFVLLKKLGNSLIIELIAVDPNHRGKKIASNLLNELKRYINKNQQLEVGTQSRNLAAMQLYKSNGFVCTHTKKVFHFFRNNNS